MPASRSLTMPKLGLTMTEGVLAEWRVAPGDKVQAGDILYIVETDKIANEIEATEEGTIEALHAAAGDVLPVGATLATLRLEAALQPEGGSVPTPFAAKDTAPAPAAPHTDIPDAPAAAGIPQGLRIVASPLARRRAALAGVELSMLVGSGPRGRIQADDVAAAIGRESATSAAAGASVQVAVPSASVRPAPSATPSVAVEVKRPAGTVLPLGRYQQVAARRLTASKREIPHFYVFAETDVTDLLTLRGQLNADPGRDKITVNHFLITAVARALGSIPLMNRVWCEEGMIQLAQVDVGIAVESPKGLLAPVLRDLAQSTVDDTAHAALVLVEAARSGRLPSQALEGGAVTISNVGMFGATGLLPIINPGQSSIMGVGRNRPEFRPDEALQPRLRQILGLSLACDHRVIDGALAARFLQSIQASLEAPLSLLRRPSQGPE